VPLHLGMKDVHKFGPSNKSIVSYHDFNSTADFVRYIKYLDENETAYNEYVQWRRDGPTKRWNALINISRRHSDCRLCIRAADLYRRRQVQFVGSLFPADERRFEEYERDQQLNATLREILVRVRPRGTFWFRTVSLPANISDRRWTDFRTAVEALWPKEDIFRFDRLPMTKDMRGKRVELDEKDAALHDLHHGDELEVIFDYSPWYEFVRNGTVEQWHQFERQESTAELTVFPVLEMYAPVADDRRQIARYLHFH